MRYQRLDGTITTADDPERGVWFSACCSWWTDKWDELDRGPCGIPCCPYCGSIGYAAPAKDVAIPHPPRICTSAWDVARPLPLRICTAVPAVTDGRITLLEDLHSLMLRHSLSATDNVLAPVQDILLLNHGPAPKDGTIILGYFGGTYRVCWWDSWPVGGEDNVAPPDGYESGWVTDGDNVDGEPTAWCVLP